MEFGELKIPDSETDRPSAIIIAIGAATAAIGIGYLIYRVTRSNPSSQTTTLSRQFFTSLLPEANYRLIDDWALTGCDPVWAVVPSSRRGIHLGVLVSPESDRSCQHLWSVTQSFKTAARNLGNHLWPKRGIFELPAQAFFQLVYHQFGLTFPPSSFPELTFWKAAVTTRPREGVEQALEAVQQVGLPVAVVSNLTFSAGVITWELQRQGLAHYIRFVCSSADYGVRKPCAALFRAAAGRLGQSPEVCWFVGDNYQDDVQGARAVGMTPVWYNSAGNQPGGNEYVVTCSHWSEFPTILNGTGLPSLQDKMRRQK